VLVTEWLKHNKQTADLTVGYFGASTGAAAALIAAAQLSSSVSAVVSRGGRPDLAGDHLYKVKAPTLLIVGALDHEVIQLNEMAYAKLSCIKEMSIIPHATHLFEEEGTLEVAAVAARDWFMRFLW
jgi:dienelactone hydrolase